MANKEIAIEYTEEKYTSRNEMSRSIGFQISDLMWKKVTDYRANFNHVISLKWFGQKNFVLCLYPTFSSKLNQLEGKINKLIADANSLDKTNGDHKHFKVTCLKNVLKNVATRNDIHIEDDQIIRLINSENPYNDSEDRLVNYAAALKYIDERYVNNVDVDFLAELYSRVSGISELTYFYRTKDDTNLNSMSLVSRVYGFAPAEYIEIMMNSLFDFIKNSSMSAVNKALISYNYVLMVKPFNDFNEEIAVLIAKAVLAHFVCGDVASCINLEILNLIKEDNKKKINSEVQQNTDFTYALTNYANLFDESLTNVLNLLREYTVKEIKNDFYKIDEPVVTVEAPKPEPVSTSTPVEEIKITKEVKIVDNEPIKVHETIEKVVIETPTETPKGLAVNYIPPVLDEKTASRLEEHLLEMDVCLKRGEAHFFARHCTLGMYYTIDQYKKSIKCVYETARTSMEHLVELGYYSKKQVGKKFVYTPIERK